jgi:hypothetical protein
VGIPPDPGELTKLSVTIMTHRYLSWPAGVRHDLAATSCRDEGGRYRGAEDLPAGLGPGGHWLLQGAGRR